MLDDAAGAEPERILVVRFLRMALERAEPDLRAAVLSDGVIELDALAFGDEGIVEFGETPARLAPWTVRLLDHRPAHAGVYGELVVRSHMLVLHVGKRAVVLV